MEQLPVLLTSGFSLHMSQKENVECYKEDGQVAGRLGNRSVEIYKKFTTNSAGNELGFCRGASLIITCLSLG